MYSKSSCSNRCGSERRDFSNRTEIKRRSHILQYLNRACFGGIQGRLEICGDCCGRIVSTKLTLWRFHMQFALPTIQRYPFPCYDSNISPRCYGATNDGYDFAMHPAILVSTAPQDATAESAHVERYKAFSNSP